MKNTIKRALSCLKPQFFIITIIFIFSLLSVVSALYAPMLMTKIINAINGKNNVDFNYIGILIIYMLILFFVSALLSVLMGALSAKVSAVFITDLRDRAFAKINALSAEYFDRALKGDILSRFINDSQLSVEALRHTLRQFFTTVITLIAAVIFMQRLSLPLTLTVLISMPLVYFISKAITKKSNAKFKEQLKDNGGLTSAANEAVRAFRTIKALGLEKSFEKNFNSLNEKLYYSGEKAQFYSSLINPLSRFAYYISYILIGLAGAFLTIRGSIDVGILAGFLTYSALFSKPVNEFSSLYTQILSGLSGLNRIFAFLDAEDDTAALFETEEINSLSGSVEFKNISFSYDKDTPLIENFNLNVPKNSLVAIVGPTGAGKTTIVNLLMGFFNPDKGEILIDNMNITKIKKESLRRNIGIVLQDTRLQKATIRENIAFGKPLASEEEIIKAAQNAGADGFIKALSKGYDTVIGDSSNISKGQKQLIAIARVMLKNAPLLILDEATSSIDTVLEMKILKVFSKLIRGRTSFVIAHRLSTIRKADIIIVMDKGKIIEQGSHSDLMEKDGFYKKMTLEMETASPQP